MVEAPPLSCLRQLFERQSFYAKKTCSMEAVEIGM